MHTGMCLLEQGLSGSYYLLEEEQGLPLAHSRLCNYRAKPNVSLDILGFGHAIEGQEAPSLPARPRLHREKPDSSPSSLLPAWHESSRGDILLPTSHLLPAV